MVINGNVGTVVDQKERDEYVCIGAPNSPCTQHHCKVSEKVTINIQQSSATAATVSVVMKNDVYGVSPDTTEQCLDNTNGNNWLAHKVSGEAFVFNMTKAR